MLTKKDTPAQTPEQAAQKVVSRAITAHNHGERNPMNQLPNAKSVVRVFDPDPTGASEVLYLDVDSKPMSCYIRQGEAFSFDDGW